MYKQSCLLFPISGEWTFIILYIFVGIKLDLIPFILYTSFESHFDTSPAPVPITVIDYPQNNQGEWT